MNIDSQTKDDYTKVASIEDIPRGHGTAVNANGIEITTFNVKGGFYALSNRCPHQNASLYKVGEEKINAEHTQTKPRGGVNEEELSVSCSWYLWGLDIESDEHGASGRCIDTSDAEVVDDDVYVRI